MFGLATAGVLSLAATAVQSSPEFIARQVSRLRSFRESASCFGVAVEALRGEMSVSRGAAFNRQALRAIRYVFGVHF